MIFGHDLQFWFAVAGATLFKLLTSEFGGPFRAVATVFAAVFSAWLFTEPALSWFALDAETFELPMAALIAITGEGVMKWLIAASNDPSRVVTLLKSWRAK